MSFNDTFYFALCMTVLLLGVVYWFWTQNQYLQRKLNTLEQIVYEMKSAFNSAVTAPDAILNATLSPAPPSPVKYAPPPQEDDLLHANLMSEEEGDDGIAEFEDLGGEAEPLTMAPPPPSSSSDAPVLAGGSSTDFTSAWGTEDESPLLATTGGSETDLQPGGGATVKEFVTPDSDSSGTVLDGMTVKELRRLAEQKNISNAKQLKRHELVAAIRHATAKPINVMEATLSLQ